MGRGVIVEKVCSSCGRSLPATLEFFASSARAKDGFRSICKTCERGASDDRATLECSVRISPKCLRTWSVTKRTAARKDGVPPICTVCARELTSGASKPAAIAPELFGAIDSEGKAYALGWIAAEGTIAPNGILIAIHDRDEQVIAMLEAAIGSALPRGTSRGNRTTVKIVSAEAARDAAGVLGVEHGKKAIELRFPELSSIELGWAFLRGVFDASGTIVAPGPSVRRPRCSLTIKSPDTRDRVRAFAGIACTEEAATLEWNNHNALDFLARLYDHASYFLARKRVLYRDWAAFIPSMTMTQKGHARAPIFRWTRLDPSAVPPFKERGSDSGYDLTLIRRAKQLGNVVLFGTGLVVEPDYGWYFDVVPRSSIIKTGYMLANSIGVIDRAYRGEILVPLIKIDPGAPDLVLPCRIVQMIPRPIVHAELILSEQLEDTSRGEGGFGSTDPGGRRLH